MFKAARRWRTKIGTVPTYTAPLKEKKKRNLLNWQLFVIPLQTQWSQLHDIQHPKCFCTTCHIIFWNFDHSNAITNLTFVSLLISIMWQRHIDRCLGCCFIYTYHFSTCVRILVHWLFLIWRGVDMFTVMLFVACAKLVQLLAVAVFSIWSHGAAKASLLSFF